MNIIEIRPQQDFTLYIKADNGENGVFDVRPYLHFESFSPLKKMDEFVKINNGGYFVEWDCGADLSADTIFARWAQRKSVQSSNLQDTAHSDFI